MPVATFGRVLTSVLAWRVVLATQLPVLPRILLWFGKRVSESKSSPGVSSPSPSLSLSPQRIGLESDSSASPDSSNTSLEDALHQSTKYTPDEAGTRSLHVRSQCTRSWRRTDRGSTLTQCSEEAETCRMPYESLNAWPLHPTNL